MNASIASRRLIWFKMNQVLGRLVHSFLCTSVSSLADISLKTDSEMGLPGAAAASSCRSIDSRTVDRNSALPARKGPRAETWRRVKRLMKESRRMTSYLIKCAAGGEMHFTAMGFRARLLGGPIRCSWWAALLSEWTRAGWVHALCDQRRG